jgi:uncharacterized protein (DUF302 family)
MHEGTSELAYSRPYRGSVDEAVETLGTELKQRGFGVLATLRVHEILAEKIGERIDPLVILDVCSPRHAHRSLSVSRQASLLLPCKIVVSKEGTGTLVALQRPTTALRALLPLPGLAGLGSEVEGLLREAVDAAVGAPPRP